MRVVILALVAAIGVGVMQVPSSADCMYGCCARPACGKVCKLVCEKKKLTAVGYGSDCKSICVPGPSRQGCKHCYVTCCNGDECPACDCPCGCKSCVEQKPKIEFCWYDWFACGCAKPREIRVLTKFQAEKEICWYHWEVVDACECCCPACGETAANSAGGEECPCVYKEAPPEARIGDLIALSYDDQKELAPIIGEPAASEVAAAPAAEPTNTEAGAIQTASATEAMAEPVADANDGSLLGHLKGALRLSRETQ